MESNILTDYQRTKLDNSPDSIFYRDPRFVHHLDRSFRNRLTSLYSEVLSSDSVVLDLMSSWVSHLPKLKFNRVIGHGLNELELKANSQLDEFWVQDLNLNQQIPLNNGSIDYCLLVAGWQYLQYPEKVSAEIRRVIRPNGKFIISFSNRAFWNKSPNIWLEANDKERIKYVSSILTSQGWSIENSFYEILSSRNFIDSLFFNSDPFFSVIAEASS